MPAVPMSASGGNVLQKPKVAAPRIFRENEKRETIPDSCTLNRVAEVAGEFNVRGSVPNIFIRKTRPQLAGFLTTCAKRLLQHNRGTSGRDATRAKPAFLSRTGLL